jgi:GntP family gluconate:H+ symporter
LYRPGLTEVEARKISTSHFVHVVEQAARDFGNSAGGIGIVIALAAIIGMGLMESGAADKIVRRFMSVFGEQRAGAALLASGFFLSIPVFFDTVFFLLIPLARALGVRTGRQFMFYVMAIGGGGALTHSIVPPTPGPLLVGNELNLPLGVTILTGFLAGLPPAIVGLYVARWLDRKVPVPVREVPGASLADLNAVIARKDEELPPFWLSVLPVVLPVAFIALASFLAMARDSMPGLVSAMGGQESFAAIFRWFDFLGNKIVALLIGALLALGIHLHQSRLSFAELGQRLGPPLETAGIIILITSAGGAFGAMIRHAGVGDSIKAMAEGYNISLILLAWAVTAVVRVAQGSATVAMITGAGLMAGVIGDGSGLPYHPFYIYLAIGFGSMILSWMNDSGFWVVAKLSGFTEKETLKSWTVLLTVLSVVGLIQTLIVAAILPFRMAPLP